MPKYKMTENLDLGMLATFMPNKQVPRYDWFYYKEGYARDLVFLLLEEFGISKGQKVLDPFNGSGTTLLTCREKGIDAVGTDVSELAVFASNVKCRNYDVEKLKAAAKKVVKAKFKPVEVKVRLDLVKRAFSKYALQDIFFFRQVVEELDEDQEIKDFFKLALINTTTKVTYAEKKGGSIKINKKRNQVPFRIMLNRVIRKMIKDVMNSELPEADCRALFCDARRLKPIADESIDAVITSPPYLNKIEYTNVYAIETYLFFDENMGKPAIKSYIGDHFYESKKPEAERQDVEQEDVFEGKYSLPEEAHPYFRDMKQNFSELFRVLKKGGKAAIVVGNGCFPDGVVKSDELLTEIAEQVGFTVDRIEILRKIWCMKNRVEKVGLMNESIIYLQK